jgi:hypothetical protein
MRIRLVFVVAIVHRSTQRGDLFEFRSSYRILLPSPLLVPSADLAKCAPSQRVSGHPVVALAHSPSSSVTVTCPLKNHTHEQFIKLKPVSIVLNA